MIERLSPTAATAARQAIPLAAVLVAVGSAYHRVTTRAVLWDLGYVLNHAYRIAQGDRPYRDFPLPHPPGTFLIQALLVRLGGPSYRMVIAYVLLATAVSAFLTYAVIRSLLREWPLANALAGLLTLPLAVLGIYMIYPHPFYDPDATLFMLLGIAGVLAVRYVTPTPVVAIPVGMLLVVPMFIKQNLGVPYFLLVHATFLTQFLEGSRAARRRWAFVALGSLIGLTTAIALIAFTVGVGNYLHWTVEFAGNRLPSGIPGFDGYTYPQTRWAVAAIVGAVLLLRYTKHAVFAVVAAALLAVIPGRIVFDSQYVGIDDGVLKAWPVVIAMSCLLVLPGLFSRRPTFEDLLPFVVAGVTHGSYLSQGLAGSTYGLWPFVLIAFACVVRVLLRYAPGRENVIVLLPALLSIALVGGGAVYLESDMRLGYAEVRKGPLVEAETATLAGLHERGPILPDLDELIRFVRATVPEDEHVLALPGEDPFYFALDRKPRFPVLLFDTTVNPYSFDRLVELMRQRDIRWLVVKEKLQIGGDPPTELVEVLTRGFRVHTRLAAYTVYVRA